jgi:purine-binding chemotaxis protein CheW
MLGLAGIRGNLVPVYALAALLGHEAREPPRWFALSSGSDRVALAFAELEGYLERPRSEVRAAAEGEARRAHVRERLHAPDGVRAIIELASLAAAIEERVATATVIKES